MKRYVPQRPQDEQELSLAKSRMRVAAVQAGPSALVRRHPWSAVIGTAAGTFALTAVVKLFMTGTSSDDESAGDERNGHATRKNGSDAPRGSALRTVLRSAMSLGLPLIQSQLTKHFLNRTHEQHQQQSYAGASGVQERADAVG